MSTTSVRRRDMGVAGAIIVLSQAITSLHSSQSISSQVDELKKDLQSSKIEREQYFVRKTELAEVSGKMDKLSNQIASIKTQVSLIRTRVEENYSMEECDPTLDFFNACKEMVSRD